MHARRRRQRRFDETDADPTVPRRGRVLRALPPGAGRRSLAPTLSGETGLFEVLNAEHACRRAASRSACPGACGTGRRRPFPARCRCRTILSATTCSASAGASAYGLYRPLGDAPSRRARTATRRRTASSGRGSSTATTATGCFARSETDKVRLGTKFLLNPQRSGQRGALPRLRVPDAVQERRERARNVHAGLRTSAWPSRTAGSRSPRSTCSRGKVGTTTSPGDSFTGYTSSNEWTNAIGLAIPIVPNFFTAIGELNRVHYDGGDTQPPALLGNAPRRALRVRRLHGVRRRADRDRPLGPLRGLAGQLRRRHPGRVGPRHPPAREDQDRRRRGAPAVDRARAAAAGSRSRGRTRPGARRAGRRDGARRPPGHLDDGRDPLRRRQEPPHEHRQGDPRRRRPAPEEQPRRDLHRVGLDRREGKGATMPPSRRPAPRPPRTTS